MVCQIEVRQIIRDYELPPVTLVRMGLISENNKASHVFEQTAQGCPDNLLPHISQLFYHTLHIQIMFSSKLPKVESNYFVPEPADV